MYFSEVVGKPTQGKDPHPLERFQKNPFGFDDKGDRVALTKILKRFFEDYHGNERLDESVSGQQSSPF